MSSVSDKMTVAADGTDRSRILVAGLVAVGGSIVANLAVRLILGPLLSLDPTFPPFGLGQITIFTAVFTLAAVLIFWLLARFVKHPARTFVIIAVVAFVVTLLPNLALAANPTAAPVPGSSGDFLTLILFHIPPALITVWALTRLTRG